MPSRTKRGATRSSTPRRASATSRRIAGVRRNRRSRRAGNAGAADAGIGFGHGTSLRAAVRPGRRSGRPARRRSPAAEAPQASWTPARPAARAASAVVGPMHTTCGGTGTAAPSGVRSATNACTEEVAVKVMRVRRRPPGEQFGRRASRAAPCGTPRRGSPSQPLSRRPARRVSGARSAHGNSTRRGTSAVEVGEATPPAPRALCSAGTRSGSTPARRRASAVAGPTAATSTEPSARGVAQLGHEAVDRVDRGEHHPSARGHATAAAARSAAPPSAGSTCRSGGARSRRRLPRASASTSPSARRPERVTTTMRPARGPPRRRRRRSWAPSAATGPTTITAGGPRSTSARARQRRAHHALRGGGAPRDHRHRRVRRAPAPDERVGDGGPGRHAHEDDQGPAGPSQRVPVRALRAAAGRRPGR